MKPLPPSESSLPQLQEADVVLIRHKKSLFRGFLRKVLDSYWDHTALVVYPKSTETGVEHTIIAEALGKGKQRLGKRFDTVNVHRLDKYLAFPDKYDVGIRRVPSLTNEDRQRIVYYMIANVDAPYWPWNVTRVMLASISPSIRTWVRNTQRYSCSSLIQKAFYDALPWDQRSRVVFKTGTVTPLILQELTSPGDIGSNYAMVWVHNRH